MITSVLPGDEPCTECLWRPHDADGHVVQPGEAGGSGLEPLKKPDYFFCAEAKLEVTKLVQALRFQYLKYLRKVLDK